jgi:hypothetical protein
MLRMHMIEKARSTKSTKKDAQGNKEAISNAYPVAGEMV